MNRYIILALFLQSCAVIQPSEAPKILKTLIWGADKIDVSKSFYDEMEYSFANVRIGRLASAILVLSSVDNDVYTWLGPNNERIITQDGKVIYTSGLQHNINYLEFTSIDNYVHKSSYMLELLDPSAIIEVELEYLISKSKVIENFYSPVLDWRGENLYFINESGKTYKSIQYYHPMAPKITIDFYFK